jgi:hypothetical protein
MENAEEPKSESCVNCGCKEPHNVTEIASPSKSEKLIQAVNNDDEEIEFGAKLEKLLKSDAKDDEVDNSVIIHGQRVDTSKYTRVELPNGMFITVPKDSDKANANHMKQMLSDVPEDDATDYDPAQQQETHTYFETKDGALVDLGDGPAKSEYKPGQLKHLQEKYRESDAFKATQKRVEAVQTRRAFEDAVDGLSLSQAFALPFVVLWKKFF